LLDQGPTAAARSPSSSNGGLPSAAARRLRGDIGQSLALTLLAAAFLARALLSGGMFIAFDTIGTSLPWTSAFPATQVHNGLLSDTVGAYLPWRVFFDATLKSGVWPLWNPYILAGHPTFASISEQVFYPLNALFAVVPAQNSFGWLAWIHLSIAGIGTRAFARLHLPDDVSACLAAIVVMFAGPTVVWLEYPFFLSTLAWTGLLFYFLERVLRERRLSLAVATGLVLGLELLGGHTQIDLYVAILGLIYLIWRFASILLHDRSAVPAVVALCSLALLIGAGIGSIAFVPAIEFVGFTQRSPLSTERLLGTTLPIQNLVTFVLPNAFGTPVRHDFVGVRNYNEATDYLGLLPILLAVPFVLARSRSSAIWAFLLGTGLFGLALYGWRPAVEVVGSLPGVRYFVLNRLATVLPFTVGLLAGVGYGALPATERRRIVSSIGALTAAGAVAAVIIVAGEAQSHRPGPGSSVHQDLFIALAILIGSSLAILIRIWAPSRSAWRWIGPAVLVLDLFSYGWDYNTVVSPDLLGPVPVRPLGVVATGPMAPRAVGISTDQLTLAPNLGMLWSIPTPDGYTSEFLARYGNFADRASPISLDGIDPSLHIGADMVNLNQARDPYLALLGARFIVTSPDPEFPDTVRRSQDGVTQPIFGATTVGSFFRARQDGLHRIDVYPSLSGHPLTHWLALHLKTSPSTPDHLAYVRVNPDSVVAGKPLTFYFKPIPDSAGRLYYFYLDAPEATAEDSVRLTVSHQPTPADEPTLVDDKPVSGSLAFATYAAPTVNWRLLDTANGTSVYDNPNALPRAFVVNRVRPLTDDAFYQAMDTGAFDPKTEAAVATAPPAFAATLIEGKAPPGNATVTVDAAGPNRIDLSVMTVGPGLVVVSNSWYPGWLGSVDGTSTAVERVDAVFQGIYVPAGLHHVRLEFAPMSLRIGVTQGAAGIILAGVALAIDAVAQRKRHRRELAPVTLVPV
jgi:hypothetical protein